VLSKVDGGDASNRATAESPSISLSLGFPSVDLKRVELLTSTLPASRSPAELQAHVDIGDTKHNNFIVGVLLRLKFFAPLSCSSSLDDVLC